MPNGSPRVIDFKEWGPFLRDVDQRLQEEITLHCLGGFVLRVMYDIPRHTGDLDYLEAIPSSSTELLDEVAGENSALAKRHGLWIHFAGPTDMPDDYEDRLTDITDGLKYLKLLVPDIYDLLLSKLPRNGPKDRDDVKYVIQREGLSFDKLRERFKAMRFTVGSPQCHALTLETWEDFFQR